MTGYTSALIKKNLDFKGFVSYCATGIDYLYSYHSSNDPASLPAKIEPSDYYLKEIEQEKNELYDLNRMTYNERIAYGQKEKDDCIAQLEKDKQEKIAELEKLSSTLTSVLAWTPPSAEHQGLKDFMIQQLTDSMSHQDVSYYNKQMERYQKLEPLELYQQQVDYVKDNIERYEQCYQEEVERANKSNDWVQKLKQSLEN